MRGRECVALMFGAAAMSGVAFAHPGSKILTTGSVEQTVMTAGVSFEEMKGVHVYRGRALLLGGEAAPAQETRNHIIIKRARHAASCYPAAHLRTQGFYSGAGATHRFTHGFFSDRVYP